MGLTSPPPSAPELYELFLGDSKCPFTCFLSVCISHTQPMGLNVLPLGYQSHLLWSRNIIPCLPGSRLLMIFSSRCKCSILTTRQPMVECYLLTFSRFSLRTQEHKFWFSQERVELTISALAGVYVDNRAILMGTKSCTKILNFSTIFSCENFAVEDFVTLFMGKKYC